MSPSTGCRLRISCAISRPHASARDRLAALLHDAGEYVVGDLISSFKSAVRLDYKQCELRLLEAIHIGFGLPPVLPNSLSGTIKRAGQIAAYLEATELAGFEPHEAKKLFGQPQEGLEYDLAPRSADDIKLEFVKRFTTCLARMDAE
jgi:Predicted hydrolases of HD superfamily